MVRLARTRGASEGAIFGGCTRQPPRIVSDRHESARALRVARAEVAGAWVTSETLAKVPAMRHNHAMDRRRFVSALAGATLAPVALPGFLPDAIRRLADASVVRASRGIPEAPPGPHDPDALRLASDEDFWEPIQRAFDVNRTVTTSTTAASPRHRRT